MRDPIWSPVAEAELDELLFFIGVTRRQPETAVRLYFEIREAVNDHFQGGKPGHKHPSLPDRWRYLKFKRWLIAYEQSAEGLTVHRIVDAARDLAELFGRGA